MIWPTMSFRAGALTFVDSSAHPHICNEQSNNRNKKTEHSGQAEAKEQEACSGYQEIATESSRCYLHAVRIAGQLLYPLLSLCSALCQAVLSFARCFYSSPASTSLCYPWLGTIARQCLLRKWYPVLANVLLYQPAPFAGICQHRLVLALVGLCYPVCAISMQLRPCVNQADNANASSAWSST